MKNKSTTNTRYHIDIEVLSPVTINDGETLSPLADYFVLDGELHYVDEQKFQALLAEDESIADRYEQQLTKTDTKGVDRFLMHVVQSKEQLSRISSGRKVRFTGEKTLDFKTIIKSNGKAYIPGSSLKGAIKNAFLFYWLEKEEAGQRELERFVNNFKRAPSAGDKMKAIKYFVDEVQKKAFGVKEGYLYQPSSYLLLSDSTVLEFADLAVANVAKQSLKDGIEDWDLHTQEYIKEGAQVSFTLGITNVKQTWEAFDSSNAFVSLMQKSSEDLTALFKVLNYYHKRLQQFTDKFNLEKPTIDVRPNEAILYVGGNKGIYKTTVLLAIREYFEKRGYNFRSEFGRLLQRNKVAKYQDFPNSLSHINRQRLGMVKIRDKYAQVEERTYDESALRSGNPIEGIVQRIGKPNSEVLVNVEGKKQTYTVGGAKAVLKEKPNALQEGKRCVFYWRDNNFYFTKK